MKEIKNKILICGSDFIKAFNKALKSGKLKNYYKNKKNTMKRVYYAAREKDGSLYFYDEEPKMCSGTYEQTNGAFYIVDDDLLPELKFEEGPRKVKLELID